MNKLAHWLATIVHEKVLGATQGYGGANLEYRLIFRGPPLEILELAYEELARDGGIHVQGSLDGSMATLPVLLQYPANQLQGPKPRIGQSGKCDNDHLLDVRNDPVNPSFVALVPPGLHNNLSIESTTDEFGLGTATSTGHASFEQWWEDGFVQQAVNEALLVAGIDPSQREDAKALIRAAAGSVDEVDPDKGGHRAAWRLLSRLYSIANMAHGLSAGQALSLACGLPPNGGRQDLVKDADLHTREDIRRARRWFQDWHRAHGTKCPARSSTGPALLPCPPPIELRHTHCLRARNRSLLLARRGCRIDSPPPPPGGQPSQPNAGLNCLPTKPTRPLEK